MKAPAAAIELLDLSVREFAERLADGRTAVGGGSTAAIVLAISAGLAGMAARASRDAWEGGPGAIAQANALRARAVPLVEADARVYAEALETLRSRDELDPDERVARARLLVERSAACATRALGRGA
jgi:methenyltetrahydrofolate cyclohydrolase